MTWVITHDVDEFHGAARGYLAEDPARSTVLLTVAELVRQRGPFAYGGGTPARFGWWRPAEGGAVAGAFVHTPPYRPILGPMPEQAARALALKWRSSGAEVSGVTGAVATVRALAQEWCTGHGQWSVSRGQRLFRLGELTPPQPAPPGVAVPAEAEDVPLVTRWFARFAEDIGDAKRPDMSHLVARRVETGQIVLWKLDGVPVSMAGFSAVVAGQSRVAPVYTPAELRGRGYAGAATSAASEAARAAGAAQVVLFTDLANPTSNALYQRLGYRPLEDFQVLDFSG